MAMHGPATLSSALLARKGSAVPTGYTPAQQPTARAPRRADQSSGNPRSAPVRLVAGGGAPPPEGKRARISVRLDRDRHFRLKLTSAHLERSLQDVLIDALDSYLDQIGPEVLRKDCACLRAELAAHSGGRAD